MSDRQKRPTATNESANMLREAAMASRSTNGNGAATVYMPPQTMVVPAGYANGGAVVPMEQSGYEAPMIPDDEQHLQMNGHSRLFKHRTKIPKSAFEKRQPHWVNLAFAAQFLFECYILSVGALAAADLSYNGAKISRVAWYWMVLSGLIGYLLWFIASFLVAMMNYRVDKTHDQSVDPLAYESPCPRLDVFAGDVLWMLLVWLVPSVFAVWNWTNYAHGDAPGALDQTWRDVTWGILLTVVVETFPFLRRIYCKFEEWRNAACCPRYYDW